MVNNLTVNFKEYLIFLKKVFKENGIKNALFFSDYLPYKKRYLKINKKISFLTFSCSKINLSKNNIEFICKNKEMKKIFNNIFKNNEKNSSFSGFWRHGQRYLKTLQPMNFKILAICEKKEISFQIMKITQTLF